MPIGHTRPTGTPVGEEIHLQVFQHLGQPEQHTGQRRLFRGPHANVRPREVAQPLGGLFLDAFRGAVGVR